MRNIIVVHCMSTGKTSKIFGYFADISKSGFAGASIPLYTTIG